MATASKKTVPAVRERKALAATLQITSPGVMPSTAEQDALLKQIQDDPMVDVLVPKPFNFTLPNHQIVKVNVGHQPMPESWVEHWFVKAQGVTRINA